MNREQYLAKRFWLSGIAPDADGHGAGFGHDDASRSPTGSAAMPLAEQSRRFQSCGGHACQRRDKLK